MLWRWLLAITATSQSLQKQQQQQQQPKVSLELELDWQSDLGKPRVPRDLRPASNLPVHLVASVGTGVELPLGLLHLNRKAK